MKRFLITIFIALIGFVNINSIALAAKKQLVVDNVVADSTMLLVDFHAEALIDDAIRERLRSGFTTIFEYQVQLWSKKTLIFSQLICEKPFRLKLAYDNWDKRYRVITPTEDRKTTSLQKVEEMCLDFQKFELIPINKLKVKTNYSVTVLLLIKPISVENLQEIERALQGEKNVTDKPVKDTNPEKKVTVTNRFLKFVLAFTGLGDKIISSPKVNFYLNEKKQVVWID